MIILCQHLPFGDYNFLQIALAWKFAKGVTSPSIGATNVKHLDDAIGALDIQFTEEDVSYLEKLYVPQKIAGTL